MLLVADSGSTKADWTFVGENGLMQKISTKGINPVFHDKAFILDELKHQFANQVQPDSVNNVFYYGSGCWDQERKMVVQDALSQLFTVARFNIKHDLEGAARATCGDQPGIACILGTGSNSCLFDGSQVVDNVTNLGFLLGDEGSGTHLGKALIRAYFYREMPADLQDELDQHFPGGKTDILNNIYRSAAPNVYLASLAQIVAKHDDHEYIRQMVKKSFSEFLNRHVCKYEGFRDLPIHFVGSIAFHFGEILEELLRKRSLTLGKIIRRPIDALVAFHIQQQAV
ncbi:MAG: hypothetical protein KDC34_16075 [Saprospiraceae bacterium]|nr:hypothetical protein [Saprospiraceae bacterium]